MVVFLLLFSPIKTCSISTSSTSSSSSIGSSVRHLVVSFYYDKHRTPQVPFIAWCPVVDELLSIIAVDVIPPAPGGGRP